MITTTVTVPIRLVERRGTPRTSTPARRVATAAAIADAEIALAAPRGYIDTRATSFFRCR